MRHPPHKPRQLSPRPGRQRWRARLLVFGVGAGTSLVPATAPATVAEQRARLPPPATCKHPVAGTWQSHDFDEAHNDWTIFTLEIEAIEGDDSQLKGVIRNHTWYSDKRQPEPPACTGQLEYLISMDALGQYADGFINFGGVGTWRIDDERCGSFRMGYNLDNFSGSVDPDLQEFQSVNNDGGRAINDPTVFRRVSCAEDDEDAGPKIVLAPPPFFPPEEDKAGEGGCGVR